MKKHLTAKTLTGIACLLYIIVSVYNISASASFSVLNGDDFLSEAGAAPGIASSAAGGAFAYMAFAYRYWQGTFFSTFLMRFLNPVSGGGYPQLRTVMLLNAFFFTLSLMLFVYTAMRRTLRTKPVYALSGCALVLSGFLNLQTFADVFFGFTSAVVYAVPAAFGLFAAACFLLLRDTGKKVFAVIACVCAFLAAGGVLMVSGALCFFLLSVISYDRLETGKWNVPCGSVFLAALLSSLINTLAPGNFLRRSLVEGRPTGPLSALLATARCGFLEIEALFSDTVLLAVLLAALIAGVVRFGDEAQAPSGNRLRFALSGLLTPFVALFPLMLGNNGAGIPERGQFVFDLVLLPALLYCFYLAGLKLAHVFVNDGVPDGVTDRTSAQKKAPALSMLALIMLCVVSLNRVSVLSLPQYRMFRNLMTGRYRTYYRHAIEAYDALAESNEDDAVLIIEDAPDCYQGILATDDPDDYYNRCLAVCFGKNSVRRAAE